MKKNSVNLNGLSAADFQWYSFSWYLLRTGRICWAWREFRFSFGITINRLMYAFISTMIGSVNYWIPYTAYTNKHHK